MEGARSSRTRAAIVLRARLCRRVRTRGVQRFEHLGVGLGRARRRGRPRRRCPSCRRRNPSPDGTRPDRPRDRRPWMSRSGTPRRCAPRASPAPGSTPRPAPGTSTPATSTARGAKEIEGVYRDAAVFSSWAKGHVLAAPGVGVDEGLYTSVGKDSTPALSLARGGREEDRARGDLHQRRAVPRPVRIYQRGTGPRGTRRAPQPRSVPQSEMRSSRAIRAALKSLIASDVVFRDTTLPHDVAGRDAVLAWWDRVPNGVQLTNKEPIAGQGWSVVRWTVRQTFPTGVELALPGATVMEVRGGEVVRMTIYYNSATLRLQD